MFLEEEGRQGELQKNWAAAAATGIWLSENVWINVNVRGLFIPIYSQKMFKYHIEYYELQLWFLMRLGISTILSLTSRKRFILLIINVFFMFLYEC